MGIYSLSSNPFIIAINEVYFGETKDIKELQRCFSEYRKELFNIERESGLRKGNTIKSKEKLNSQMVKTFGFKNVDFMIDYQETLYTNAYTIPLTFDLDIPIPKINFSPAKDGMKYANKYTCLICVTHGLMLNPKYTDREVLAIILHEVGHNFYSVLTNGGTVFTGIRRALLLSEIVLQYLLTNPANLINLPFDLLSLTNTMKDIDYKVSKMLPWIQNFTDSMFYIKSFIDRLLSNINTLSLIINPVRLLLTIIFNVISRYNPLSIFRSMFAYKDEKIADSFPTMYGYGVDMASANAKMGMGDITNVDNNDNGGFLSNIMTMITLPISFLTAPVEEHPSTASRIKSNLEYLEKELLKEDLDPRMKKEIKKQINEINNILDRSFTKRSNDNIMKYGYINRLYSIWVYKTFGGDLREYISKNPHDEIEKNYMAKVKIK